jgi:hypothetical protein
MSTPATAVQAATITISLRIENTYADEGHDATTYATDARVPAPPPGVDIDELSVLDGWADQHLRGFVGTGYTHGDSWYDVTVTG